ncbi:DSS1/SEM1 [Dillenia turbinata]|uniref:26S proteasome complex subunit SEM1 n=1 Tax=Dillenia turbinata TaxID=194707 RepID=A0AAN8YUI7_9MAGN
MDDTQILMKRDLGFFGILREAVIIPRENLNFIIFTFLTSLPVFSFKLSFEILLQGTIFQIAEIIRQTPVDQCVYCYGLPEFVAVEEILEVIFPNLLLLGVLYLIVLCLDLVNMVAIVDSASMIYAGETHMNAREMLLRIKKSTRYERPLITYIYALLLAFLTSVGLASLAISAYIAARYVFFEVIFAMMFIYLTKKYVEWSVIWNMGIVVSILENTLGDIALVISSYLSKAAKTSGFLLMLVSFVGEVTLRLFCLYIRSQEEGMGILVTFMGVGFVSLGNVMKWVVIMVFFYDCKRQDLMNKDVVEKVTEIEAGWNMEKETKVATEDPKVDLFEDDDEFEEFEINEARLLFEVIQITEDPRLKLLTPWGRAIPISLDWDDKEGEETTQQWEDDWDDDDVNDDFSLQLKKELESNTEKI